MTALQIRTATPIQFIADQQDTYTDHVKHFTRWIQETGRDLDRATVIDYYQHLSTSRLSVGTQRVKRQAIKKRLRQLARAGGIGSDLSANMEQFLRDLDREGATKAPTIQPRTVGNERYMTPDEARRVLASCRGDKQTMIIKFLWATGCRVSEIIGIHRSDCKQMGDVAYYRVLGKGSKERIVKTSLALYEQVRDVFRGEEWLFETANGKQYNRTYISNQIAKVSQRAIGRPLRAHALRHSFGTQQIKNGVPISYVSRYMGHSSMSITAQFYDHGEIGSDDLIGNEL